MTELDRRRELRSQYKQSRAEAAVYTIVNNHNGKRLLGSTTNLASVRNKLAFAQSVHMPGALDHRLWRDVREFGIEAFSLEVLEVLALSDGMTAEQIRSDLATLEDLWRERFEDDRLY
jgi:hypothetical protein